MAQYKSDKTEILSSAENVFGKLSNPMNLLAVLDKIPEDKIDSKQREQLKSISVTEDSISLPGGPVGNIVLKITEKTPFSLIRFEGIGSPVPLSLEIHITETSDSTCQSQVIIDIDIPMMLKPMVSGPLQKMVDQFGTLMHQLSSTN